MRLIQSTVLTTVALVGLASVACADPPVPYSWTGFYAGGNVGYSWGKADETYSEPAFALLPIIGLPTSFSTSQKLDGVIGGVQIGYNVQGNSPWVGGFETDFQGSGERGSSSFSHSYGIFIPTFFTKADLARTEPGDPLITGTLNTSLQWFGTVRGRLGVLITPTAFVYGTGGFAYAGIKTSGTIADSFPPAPVSWSFGNSAIALGWTLGAGIEGAFPNSADWTWKVEYLHLAFGGVGGTGFDTDFGGIFSWNSTVTDDIVRGGFNLRFH
jgi:outer membrane immunogenic protein